MTRKLLHTVWSCGWRTPFVIALTICLASAGAAAAGTVAIGDFEFMLDAAGFWDGENGSFQEVYVRFPNTEIRFKENNDRLESRVRMTTLVVDESGRTVAKTDEVLTFFVATPSQADDPLLFNTITKKFKLEPGRYRLTCVAKDLNYPKVSIVGFLRGQYRTALVQHFFMEVPTIPLDKMSLSDAKFLWNLGRKGEEFQHHPNPTRMYGLYKDSLRVYVELYVPAELTGRPLTLDSVIKNDKGETVRKSSIVLPKLAGDDRSPLVKYPLFIQEDLNTFPAGAYTIYINAGVDDQLLLRVRSGNFQVAWDMRTWESSRSTYMAEARFLLGDDDFDKFVGLSVGDQETMLAKMWKELDPNPATGVNEAYEEFVARMEFIKVRYSDYQLGIFTDRGLTYLRYGPPDELVVDVIPRNRESISDAIEKVRDRFHEVNFSATGARQGYAAQQPDIVNDPRRVGAIGEGGNVGYPYELWVYNGHGNPILERDRAMEQDIGMRFLFIDRDGYGRYKLETSSTMISK